MKKALPLTNIIRHTLIVFFMLTILLPLAWVLLLSIKSMPDSMRGNLWPRKFDFNHYAYSVLVEKFSWYKASSGR